MTLFRRAIRLFLLITGILVGLITAVATLMARRMIRPPRLRLWADPLDVGMPFEDVQFPAMDGLRLSGWFIPANETANLAGATVVMVHGWPWNRLGHLVDDPMSRLIGEEAVDLLRLAHAYHHAGYNVFMFDLRNHGQSAEATPVSFGLAESEDLLGALSYLANRKDVDPQHIMVTGFSMGANATLFALPRTDLVRAAVLVQPTSAGHFSKNFAQHQFGPLSGPIYLMAELIYQQFGGIALDAIEPIFAATGAGETPLLFVQGDGDPWGSVGNVAAMAAATRQERDPLVAATSDRFGGYKYVIDNPQVALDFFEQHS
ncbi:MAG: alpha/beta fold hydrolase [Anaerolineales bacterium]|nr:alpha/beta fold hydrolase [Anaerolineales bacterium]MCB0014512.1 alpha/beta fold hydrolase [Anaerolineales bacterium]MCB0020903.1 alpha/beta fold hydrolase [Anaerolineales bacterium]MCB0028852.1 alpha/beta fold hydrolase [Anaerolineales bacterium]